MKIKVFLTILFGFIFSQNSFGVESESLDYSDPRTFKSVMLGIAKNVAEGKVTFCSAVPGYYDGVEGTLKAALENYLESENLSEAEEADATKALLYLESKSCN